ncbi:MAG: tetratricopeptide repeat protein [Verrucomicrobia bacterium]|nr:tetratricopeptide repeat protein [Verrucomicrobiota bacterium]
MPTDSPDTPRPIGEIAQGPSTFEQFLDRNQKNIVILAIVIALATAALVIYRGVVSSKEHTAGAELNKAEDIPALQTVIKEHSGTAAAHSAEVMLAARQWSENQQDTAIETLKSFLAANPEHPARPTAQASLGSKLQTQGKLADAAKVFQELADEPTARFLAPYALLALGDISKATGEMAKAEQLYQKAKTEYPDSSFSKTIDQRIALLKAQMPVEIDPPPTPPAPPANPGAPGAPGVPGVPAVPGVSVVPGAPVVPSAQPAIPGLPAPDSGSPEADVPPVANPFIPQPGGNPVENTPPATPPAATPPAATPPAAAPPAATPPAATPPAATPPGGDSACRHPACGDPARRPSACGDSACRSPACCGSACHCTCPGARNSRHAS